MTDREPMPGDYWNLNSTIPKILSAETVFDSELANRIRDLTNQGTNRNRAFTEPHTRITVSPSDLGHCLRQAILFRHYKAPPLADSQIKSMAEMGRMAQMGNALHDQATNALQSMGVAIIAELRIEDDGVPSTMRLDGFYEATDDDDLSYILEIKTMGPNQYANAAGSMEVRPKDLVQLQYYMDVKRVELGLLMVIDRAFGKLDILTIAYDEAVVNYVYEMMGAIRAADENHIIVGRPYHSSYWKCQKANCVMYKICKDLGDEEAPMGCI